MADSVNTIVVNNTSISKIMCMSRDNYLSINSNIDSYYDSTLFLVNDGTNKSTEIYLGANRFTDIIVQDVPPNSTNTPNKLYLVPTKKLVRNVRTTESINIDSLIYNEYSVVGSFDTTCPYKDGIKVCIICNAKDSNQKVYNNLSTTLSFTDYVKLVRSYTYYSYEVVLPRSVIYQGKILEVEEYTQVDVVFDEYIYGSDVVSGYDVWYLYSDNKNPQTIYPVKVFSNQSSEVIKSVDIYDGVVTLSYEAYDSSTQRPIPGVVHLPMINEFGEFVSSELVQSISSQVARKLNHLVWESIDEEVPLV